MRTKNIATFVQKKLAHTLPRQLHRSRPIKTRTDQGECWPQSDGRGKKSMWQSTGWPASGKSIPHDAQRLFSHFSNRGH